MRDRDIVKDIMSDATPSTSESAASPPPSWMSPSSSEVTSPTQGIEDELQKDFPEATVAEIQRFVTSCRGTRNDEQTIGDKNDIKHQAEGLLEEYFDWRSCYGLDYKKPTIQVIVNDDDKKDDEGGGVDNDSNHVAATASTGTTTGDADATAGGATTSNPNNKDIEDWKFAVRKALEVAESMKRAQELAKKLQEDAAKALQEEEEPPKDPYAEIEAQLMGDNSTSNNSTTGAAGGEVEGEGNNNNGDGKEEKDGTDKTDADATSSGVNDTASPTTIDEDEKAVALPSAAELERKYELPQVVYVHKIKKQATSSTNESFKEDGQTEQQQQQHDEDDTDNLVDVTDINGKLLIHIMPARIDRKLATAETYGLALALYLDRKFDRSNNDTITVVIDTRPGDGWPNPMSVTMINFVKKVSDMLMKYYPGRLEKLILTPIPRTTWYIWKSIKYIFSNRMELVEFVSGPATVKSPLPKNELQNYISESVINQMEQVRQDHFKPIGTFS